MKRLALLLALVAGSVCAQTLPESADQGSLIDQILLIFTNAWVYLQTVFTARLIGVQLGSIALSVVIAWLVAAPVKARLYARADQLDPERKSSKTILILYRWLARITSSIVAVTALGVTELALLELHVIHKTDTLYFMHLANFIWLAYAGVKTFVYLLRGAFGRDHVSAGVENSLVSIFWFFVVLQLLGILPGVVGFLKGIEMPFLGQGMTLWLVVTAVFWCIISLLVAGWFVKVYSEWIQSQDTLHPNIRTVFDRVGRIILMVVAVLLVLDAIGFNLAVLSVFGGALGVGIGFGLQKIASNYISGFIILLDRSIKLGDLVRVAGFQGTVREINTRYTVVRNTKGIECIVPNENFVTSVVENMSYSDTHVRGTTTISVAYDADIDLAIRILLEIADEHPRVDHSRSNYALVTNFGADGVDIELGYWIADPQNGTGRVKSDINIEILRRFDKAGIEVPYAQREIRLRGEPTIRVVRGDSEQS